MSPHARGSLGGRRGIRAKRPDNAPTAGYSEMTRLARGRNRQHLYHDAERSRQHQRAQDMNPPESATPVNRPRETTPPSPAYGSAASADPLPVARAVSSALALAACGGSSKPRRTSNESRAAPAREVPRATRDPGFKAAACIRTHGVPDFPDPTFGAGGAQVNLSPARGRCGPHRRSRWPSTDCAKLRPGARRLCRATHEKPTAADHRADGRPLARCMRAHCRVPNFPDPTTTPPREPRPPTPLGTARHST